MLTRLHVKGFKNLADVDVRFGPFTCLTGENDAGKSNLFDVITFLSALSEKSFLDAACSVRGEGDLRGLFHQGGGRQGDRLWIAAELLIPAEGVDELGQKASATTTLVRYELDLRLDGARLALVSENLIPLPRSEAYSHLLFPHTVAWRSSVATGAGRRGAEFISTDGAQVRVHQEGRQGRTRTLVSATLPRTVLSSVNAVENPTAALVQHEMRNWRVFQFDPAALRRPDPVTAPARLASDGSNFAATLYRLIQSPREEEFQEQIATRLREFLPGIDSVMVDRDDGRALLTAIVRRACGTRHPVRALSDSALRVLALSVLGLDPSATGLLCFEEPASGVHPARIAGVLTMLTSMASDVTKLGGRGNPLRQVMIISQSPAIVGGVGNQDLLIAAHHRQGLSLHAIAKTWRAEKARNPAASPDMLAAYLDPLRAGLRIPAADAGPSLVDPDFQLDLPLGEVH
ncbi:MAG: AAA family ATPase [Bryobacterales bacterium]|nr:AAA family ATPase [Bryobacterales bacterium]